MNTYKSDVLKIKISINQGEKKLNYIQQTRGAIHTSAIIKNYNNEFLTMWQNAHVIMYKCNYYKKIHGKEGYTKLYQDIVFKGTVIL